MSEEEKKEVDEKEGEAQEDGEEVLKYEDIGYIKGLLSLLQGWLKLTPTHIRCKAHYTSGRALPFIKRWIEKERYGFDIEYKDIAELSQGRLGVQKNVIKIITGAGKKYRILVKDYEEWEKAINEQRDKAR